MGTFTFDRAMIRLGNHQRDTEQVIDTLRQFESGATLDRIVICNGEDFRVDVTLDEVMALKPDGWRPFYDLFENEDGRTAEWLYKIYFIKAGQRIAYAYVDNTSDAPWSDIEE